MGFKRENSGPGGTHDANYATNPMSSSKAKLLQDWSQLFFPVWEKLKR